MTAMSRRYCLTWLDLISEPNYSLSVLYLSPIGILLGHIWYQDQREREAFIFTITFGYGSLLSSDQGLVLPLLFRYVEHTHHNQQYATLLSVLVSFMFFFHILFGTCSFISVLYVAHSYSRVVIVIVIIITTSTTGTISFRRIDRSSSSFIFL